MKTILSPIDFSEASGTSSEYAAMLARDFGAQLILAHAYTEPLVIGDIIPDLLTAGQELYAEKNEAVLAEARLLSKKHGIVAEGEARMGRASDIIHDLTDEKQADLIVMGTKGEAKTHGVFGSTTVATLRKTAIPVMVIPEGTTYQPIRNITLAADFQFETDIFCLFFLKQLIQKFDASLHILNIYKKSYELEPLEMAGKLSINNLLEKFKPVYHELPDRNTEHGILNFIQSCPTNLLVTIAHHHNLFGRLFLKQLTPALTHHSPVPLLVLKDE